VVHFVLERHLGIARGVFGQLAAGGTAGTFFTIPHRRGDPGRRISARLAALGREDTARSDRLAGASMAAWHARHGRRWAFAGAVDVAETAAVSEPLLDELDDVAQRWHELAVAVGAALTLTLTWPAELTLRPAGSAHGRRPSRDRGVAVRRR
jgi:hypothetical protein